MMAGRTILGSAAFSALLGITLLGAAVMAGGDSKSAAYQTRSGVSVAAGPFRGSYGYYRRFNSGNGSRAVPAGRRYYDGRYFGNYNNRYYGPQYGYF